MLDDIKNQTLPAGLQSLKSMELECRRKKVVRCMLL